MVESDQSRLTRNRGLSRIIKKQEQRNGKRAYRTERGRLLCPGNPHIAGLDRLRLSRRVLAGDYPRGLRGAGVGARLRCYCLLSRPPGRYRRLLVTTQGAVGRVAAPGISRKSGPVGRAERPLIQQSTPCLEQQNTIVVFFLGMRVTSGRQLKGTSWRLPIPREM